jgi:group II intron reverse transcriptase/maturase
MTKGGRWARWTVTKVCEMQKADVLLDIYQKRGSKGLHLERVYRHLFDPNLFLQAYGNIYRNFGAMTRGTTKETVDEMSLQKINTIIGLLKMERYRWTPVRRSYIEKQDGSGKKRPLGIPTWSDKLVQETVRSLLEPYYEQKFSNRSHGFRPNRSCHTALLEIRTKWKGTVWFIEGDIKGCFDNIDHKILLSILQRDIHDGRLTKLINGLLDAGYMEDWRYYDTPSGTPQGGIISPLLANIYLNELDRYIEDTLIPAYTRGEVRKKNQDYVGLRRRIKAARNRNDTDEVKRLIRERRKTPSTAPQDPDYRRLRYIRYADDFLLGFVGPKHEANDIRRQIGEFLERKLKLTMSVEKTLITHAGDEKAKFLGYELKAVREGDLIAKDGRRATNGAIALLMPRKVVIKYRKLFSKRGKIIQRGELVPETDYTIIQRYQSTLRGLYNFYCMANNVSRRMGYIGGILKTSLLKTLANKYKSSVAKMQKKYQVVTPTGRVLQVTIERPDKEPLIATYGGFPLKRIPRGQGMTDYTVAQLWNKPASHRSELVQRLLAGKCELCGKEGPLESHHIRKLADIDRPGKRPAEHWQKVMAARKRKSLVVCLNCHRAIHAGRYDGRPL